MSPSGRSHRLGWVLLLLLAVGYRLLAHAEMSAAADTFAPIIDSEAYLVQALAVASGHDISEGVYFQAPLYPWVLGLTLRAAGVPGVVGAESTADVPPDTVARALAVGRWLNMGFGLLAVVLVTLLAQRLFGAGAGWCAGVLAALCSPFVFYEGMLLKGSLSLLFLPWAVLAAERALTTARPRVFAWSGLALGLGALVRGNLHAVTLVGAVVLLVWGWRRGRLPFAWRGAMALGFGVLIALAPVIVRNSLVSGRAVLSTAAGGTAFYLCNEPGNDTGLIQHRAINRQVPLHELEDWTALAQERTGRALSAAEVSSYWAGEALAGISRQPGTWLLAEARKFCLLFSGYEAPDNSMPSFAEPECAALRLSPVHYGLLLPLALGGAALAWLDRRRRSGGEARAALVVALLAYAASLLLFVVTSRFRLPMLPLVVVLAGACLARLPGLLRDRTQRGEGGLTAMAMLGGVLLGHAADWPVGPLTPRERASHVAVCLKNRAQVRLARGALSEADSDLYIAIALSQAAGIDAPALHVERARLARLRLVTEAPRIDVAAAREQFETSMEGTAREELARALALSADDAATLCERGLLDYALGRYADAADALQRSLALQPREREALAYRALALLYLDRDDEAGSVARQLTTLRPDDDDGWALLALALHRTGQEAPALEALDRHDQLASMREAAGIPRRFPDQPEFRTMRSKPEDP